MPRATHVSELESAGFRLADESQNQTDRAGTMTSRHYVLNRNDVGLRPVTHHVYVDEFEKKPGRYKALYQVTQGKNSYDDFSKMYDHKDNVGHGGSIDPIKDIIHYHRAVSREIDSSPDHSTLYPVDVDNVHKLLPGKYNWRQDPGSNTHYLRRGPGQEFRSLSAAGPMDIEVARRLKGVGFEYHGRFPGDEETDLYHKSYPWPGSSTFQVDFTVRHRPASPDAPYSYSARRVQSGVNDDGSVDSGSSIDVTGESQPVANLDTINRVIRRHNAVKDALGIGRGKTAAVDPTINSHEGLLRLGWTPGSEYEADWYHKRIGDKVHVLSREPDGWIHNTGTSKDNMTGKPMFHDSLKDALLSVNGVGSAGLAQFKPPDPRLHNLSGSKTSGEFEDIVGASGHSGTCLGCGKATYDYPEGINFRDDKSYSISPEDEAPDMHGPDINMCGACSTDYDTVKMAVHQATKGRNSPWHWNDQGVPGCAECGRHSMDKADEDLIL